MEDRHVEGHLNFLNELMVSIPLQDLKYLRPGQLVWPSRPAPTNALHPFSRFDSIQLEEPEF
jgi:hypothetical protein